MESVPVENMELDKWKKSSSQINNNNNKKKRSLKKKARCYYRSNLACFRAQPSLDRVNDQDTPSTTTTTVPVATDDGPSRSHLLIMINGIVGSSNNWRYAGKQFQKTYPEQLLVHRSQSNHTIRTFDGVDVMGERLADEVVTLVQQNPQLQKISFVCHSLGGLISRYAIARLYGTHYLDRLAKMGGGDYTLTNGFAEESDSLKEKYEGKIAGLEPVNFITSATPHLGSEGHKQVPLFSGNYRMEGVARRISWLLGRSGRHLFLTDRDNGNPPLLLQMVNDLEGYPFITALKSFRRRVLYANVHFDLIVGWSTSSLRHRSELPERRNLSRDMKYKHVVNCESPKAANVQDDCSWETIANNWKNWNTEEMTRVMLKALTRLSWERVDVKFRGAKQRFLAHSTIQVQTKWLHSSGSDVIQHMIENFVL